MNIKPRALIMAGGTGGHVFPALAVAKALQQKGWHIDWLGTRHGLEADIVPKAGLPLHYISVVGVRRTGFIGLLLSPFRLLRAVFQSLEVIFQLKPNVILGMGGFASGPGGLAAWLLRKPLIIHEQNAVAGLTNRYLANLADEVFEAFPKTFKTSIKAICTGNPVREELRVLPPPRARMMEQDRPLRLLVLGGSRGAKALNEICSRSIKRISENERPEIWHQTGAGLNNATLDAYQNFGIKAKVEPFIQDMAEAYLWADLVLCRAGALTVAELAAVGVGSILVPFPYAVDDHQTLNARYLVDGNAALLVQQSMLTEEKLASLLEDFSKDRKKVLYFAENARALAKDNALDQVVTAFEKFVV